MKEINEPKREELVNLSCPECEQLMTKYKDKFKCFKCGIEIDRKEKK